MHGGVQFETAILSHGRALFRYALKLTRRATDAEDLVQETYARAWAARETYAEVSMLSWLARIMRNVFVSQLRRPKLVDMVCQEEAARIEEEVADPSTSGAQEATVMLRQALGVVAGMDAGSRSIVLAVALGDEYHEAAARTGIPLGTVKSKIHRARERLKEA